MKKSVSLLVFLFLFTYAIAQDFLPVPGTGFFCPQTTYRFSSRDCNNASWTVTNGRFIGGINTGPWVDIVFEDARTATVTMKCENRSNTQLYNIASVKGRTLTNPRVVNQPVMCSTAPVTVAVDPMMISGTSNPVSGYDWILPSGWTYQGKSGQVFTTSSSIAIVPSNGCVAGTVQATAVARCGAIFSFSRPSDIVLTRSKPSLKVSVPSGYTGPGCQKTDPVTFAVDAPPCVSSVTWTFPAGWRTQSGGSSPQTNSGSSIVLLPSGTTADAGDVSGVITLSCGGNLNAVKYTLIFPPPVLTVLGPSAICTDGATFTFSLANATLISATYSASPNIDIDPITGEASIAFGQAGIGSVTVTAQTSCGVVVSKKTPIQVGLGVAISGSSYIGVGNKGSLSGDASCGPPPYTLDWFIKNETEYSGEAFLIYTGEKLNLKAVADPSLPSVLSRTFSIYIRAADRDLGMIWTPLWYITTKGTGKIVLGSGVPTPDFAPLDVSGDGIYSVFPNPAANYFEVTGRETSNARYDIKLFNDRGEEVLSQKNVEGGIRISTEGFLPGIYSVHILDKEGTIERKRIMIINR